MRGLDTLRHLVLHHRKWLVHAKRPWFLGCVAIGLFSWYLYFKIKRINAARSSSQENNATPSHSSHGTPASITAQPDHKPIKDGTSSFPGLGDLTKRTVVSLSTLGTIFNTSPLQHKEQKLTMVLETASLATLRLIASKADLYLITRCDEDDSHTYDYVHSVLKQNGLFEAGFNPHKHLSCSTIIGKAHIARQLDSKLHIDAYQLMHLTADEAVISHLQRFTPHLLLIQNNTSINSNNININNANTSSRRGDSHQKPVQRWNGGSGSGSGAFVASSLQQQFHK